MAKARQIFGEIKAQKDSRNGRILVFTGARQVGKTTLVKKGLADYTYLSIEDPVMRGAYTALSAAQWHALYPKAALDEIQKEPRLIESVKATYDQYEDVRYTLLGSSQLLLMKQVKESLAGRCSILELYPLTLPELRTEHFSETVTPSIWQRILKGGEIPEVLPSFLLDPDMAQKQKAFEHYIKFGGYPALTATDMTDDEKFRWLSGYVRTYLERDIRDLANFRELEPFVKLQQALAMQTGTLFNASNLANRLGLSPKTVQRYLTYLDLSYQTITLTPWERNEGKRLAKMPKVHFMDNGVLQAVLQKKGGVTGAEFESLVIAEIYKQTKNILAPVKFYHLRTHDGKEIDLLAELPGGYIAFEIKMTEKVLKEDAKHLLKIGDMLDKPLLHGFVLSNDNAVTKFSEKVTAIHAAQFLG